MRFFVGVSLLYENVGAGGYLWEKTTRRRALRVTLRCAPPRERPSHRKTSGWRRGSPPGCQPRRSNCRRRRPARGARCSTPETVECVCRLGARPIVTFGGVGSRGAQRPSPGRGCAPSRERGALVGVSIAPPHLIWRQREASHARAVSSTSPLRSRTFASWHRLGVALVV